MILMPTPAVGITTASSHSLTLHFLVTSPKPAQQALTSTGQRASSRLQRLCKTQSCWVLCWTTVYLINSCLGESQDRPQNTTVLIQYGSLEAQHGAVMGTAVALHQWLCDQPRGGQKPLKVPCIAVSISSPADSCFLLEPLPHSRPFSELWATLGTNDTTSPDFLVQNSLTQPSF